MAKTLTNLTAETKILEVKIPNKQTWFPRSKLYSLLYLTRKRQDIAVNGSATRWYQSIALMVPVITLNAFSAEMSDSGATVLQSFRSIFSCG